MLFQITARDAHELAPELAEEPTTETWYEDKYIISREPVYDFLRWHDNPQIREFANRYIRPMKERLEDIRGESEAERLTRMEDLDTASLFRLEERMESVDRLEANPDRMRAALSSGARLNRNFLLC